MPVHALVFQSECVHFVFRRISLQHSLCPACVYLCTVAIVDLWGGSSLSAVGYSISVELCWKTETLIHMYAGFQPGEFYGPRVRAGIPQFGVCFQSNLPVSFLSRWNPAVALPRGCCAAARQGGSRVANRVKRWFVWGPRATAWFSVCSLSYNTWTNRCK